MTAVPLREARQAVVRDRVLDGVAELLAQGQDLTYAKVAAASDVPERTVYRYFPSRQDLMSAVVAWINERTGMPRGTTRDEAIELVRRLFPIFDEVAPVVREVLMAPEGLAARLDDNDERRAAAQAVVDNETAGLDAATAWRVAAVVQLLTSAAAWQTLRDYWGMDGAEAAETVAIALTMLLAGARADAGTPEPRPRRQPRSSSSTGGPR